MKFLFNSYDREIDALVAVNIMGWRYQPSAAPYAWTDPRGRHHCAPPYFSVRIAEAWSVVTKTRFFGRWSENIWDGPLVLEDSESGWQVSYDRSCSMGGESNRHILVKDASSAPMAICMAALKIKGVAS